MASFFGLCALACLALLSGKWQLPLWQWYGAAQRSVLWLLGLVALLFFLGAGC
jgi:hypothetical protein